MRILFLGNSNEQLALGPGVPLRHDLMREQLAPDFGGVEVVLKPAWPNEAFAGIVDRWIDEYQPDMVYLNVAEYWCLYESIPLRLERSFGWLGRPFARLGTKAAETPWISHNAIFRSLHGFVKAFVAGAPQFEPEVVVDRVMECVRVGLRREGLVMVVDGQRGRRPHANSGRGRARVEARRQHVHRGLGEACARLHVTYESDDAPQWQTHPEGMEGHRDGFHQGPEGQVWMANEATALIRRAWAEAGR